MTKLWSQRTHIETITTFVSLDFGVGFCSVLVLHAVNRKHIINDEQWFFFFGAGLFPVIYISCSQQKIYSFPEEIKHNCKKKRRFFVKAFSFVPSLSLALV